MVDVSGLGDHSVSLPPQEVGVTTTVKVKGGQDVDGSGQVLNQDGISQSTLEVQYQGKYKKDPNQPELPPGADPTSKELNQMLHELGSNPFLKPSELVAFLIQTLQNAEAFMQAQFFESQQSAKLMQVQSQMTEDIAQTTKDLALQDAYKNIAEAVSSFVQATVSFTMAIKDLSAKNQAKEEYAKAHPETQKEIDDLKGRIEVRNKQIGMADGGVVSDGAGGVDDAEAKQNKAELEKQNAEDQKKLEQLKYRQQRGEDRVLENIHRSEQRVTEIAHKLIDSVTKSYLASVEFKKADLSFMKASLEGYKQIIDSGQQHAADARRKAGDLLQQVFQAFIDYCKAHTQYIKPFNG